MSWIFMQNISVIKFACFPLSTRVATAFLRWHLFSKGENAFLKIKFLTKELEEKSLIFILEEKDSS